MDQRIVAQTLLAPALWVLGFADQARTLSDRNLGEAMSLDHPWSLVYAVVQHAFLCYRLADDAGSARKDLAILAGLAERFPWSPAGALHATISGSLEARLGDPSLGVGPLEAIIQHRIAAGQLLQITDSIGNLAEGWRRLGDTGKALATIETALERSERWEELWHHADLVRVKGEILRDRGDTAGARALFEAAIGEARARGALGWELRASLSLARLRTGLGEGEAARALLENVLAKFSEGFETTDLMAAQALLRDLA
jgi:tetratricopeptide (TPR) repeat protein